MELELQASVSQPRNARIKTGVFDLCVEVGQNLGSCGLVLESVDTDFDDVFAELDPPLYAIDELAMNNFRCLVFIGRTEVVTKVIHRMEREQTQREHGLDGV